MAAVLLVTMPRQQVQAEQAADYQPQAVRVRHQRQRAVGRVPLLRQTAVAVLTHWQHRVRLFVQNTAAVLAVVIQTYLRMV